MADASFDIVIAGTSLSGLAYGALCAKQGYTVLVVGQDDRPSGYASGDAQVFRSIPLLYGFNSSLVLRSFFRDIGLLAEMWNRPEMLEPSLQVVTPGVRLELTERAQQNRTELERAWPGTSDTLLRFLDSASRDAREMDAFLDELPLLPADGLWGRFKLRRYLRKHDVFFDSMEPVTFPTELAFTSPMTSLLLYLSRLHGRPLSPFTVRRLLQHVAGGFYEFPQGVDGIKRLFTERILTNGGAYWPERSVEQIVLKGRRTVESVIVHRPRRSVGTRVLVCNTHPRPFLSLIPEELQNARFHGYVKSLKPAWYNYMVNFVVDRSLLPSSMGRNLLLSLYPKQETSGPHVLWVHTSVPTDQEPDSPATVAACCRIESRELPLEKAGFDRLNERVLMALEWVLPFLRDKLIRVVTPYMTLDRETEQERLDPSEVQEVYDTPWDGCLDLSAFPCRTAYRNMMILGEHYLGSLGLEGAILGARQMFAWTRENVVLKQLLKK